jgi:hypothetical protein
VSIYDELTSSKSTSSGVLILILILIFHAVHLSIDLRSTPPRDFPATNPRLDFDVR